jgi:hypothetical protein
MKTVGLIVASWLATLGLSFLTIRYCGDSLFEHVNGYVVFFGIPSIIMAGSFWFFYRALSCRGIKAAVITALFSLILFNGMIWLILSQAEF